jgi:uncharacterized protein YoxC
MTPDDRAGEALEHLQRAVLEMIQAARSTLDLVEDLVADPQSLAAVVSQVGHLAQAVMTAAGQHRTRIDRVEPRAPANGRDSGDAGVQRIPVV